MVPGRAPLSRLSFERLERSRPVLVIVASDLNPHSTRP
jgi:hypothetical protein